MRRRPRDPPRFMRSTRDIKGDPLQDSHPQSRMPEEDWGQSNFQWGGELGPTPFRTLSAPSTFILTSIFKFCVYAFTFRLHFRSFLNLAATPPLRGPQRTSDTLPATPANFSRVYRPRGNVRGLRVLILITTPSAQHSGLSEFMASEPLARGQQKPSETGLAIPAIRDSDRNPRGDVHGHRILTMATTRLARDTPALGCDRERATHPRTFAVPDKAFLRLGDIRRRLQNMQQHAQMPRVESNDNMRSTRQAYPQTR